MCTNSKTGGNWLFCFGEKEPGRTQRRRRWLLEASGARRLSHINQHRPGLPMAAPARLADGRRQHGY